MSAEPIPDPLARYLRICCNPNSSELLDELRHMMMHEVAPGVEPQFRRQLAHAIMHSTMTPELYKAITKDNEYVTMEQVQNRMVEIWHAVYGDAPIQDSKANTK